MKGSRIHQESHELLKGLKYCGTMYKATEHKTNKNAACVHFSAFAREDGVDMKSFNEFAVPTDMGVSAGFKGLSKYVGRRKEPILLSESEEANFQLALLWVERIATPFMGHGKMQSQEQVESDLKQTASCGFPWSETYANKRSFLATDEYREMFGKYWDETLLMPKGPSCIWKSSLKTELRPITNGVIKEARQVSAGPIEHTVASNMYFMGQNELMYEHHGKFGSEVGINVFSGGWGEMIERLDVYQDTRTPVEPKPDMPFPAAEPGPAPLEQGATKALSCDAKKWDANLLAAALRGIQRMRTNWLEKEWARTKLSKEECDKHRHRVAKLYDDVVEALLKDPLGNLWQKKWGQLSGGSNTVNDNTLALYTVLAYSWIRTVGPDYEVFLAMTRRALYGDDMLITVKKEYQPLFSFDRIAKVALELGVVLTNESHHADVNGYVDLHEAEFFKEDHTQGAWLHRVYTN